MNQQNFTIKTSNLSIGYKSKSETITIAQKLAVLKLQNVGRLPEGINIQEYLGAIK